MSFFKNLVIISFMLEAKEVLKNQLIMLKNIEAIQKGLFSIGQIQTTCHKINIDRNGL